MTAELKGTEKNPMQVTNDLDRSSTTTFDYDTDKLPSPFIMELVELWKYRGLLQLMVVNSIKTRYKRSALGVVWSVISPLAESLILTLVFSTLFRQTPNFPVYLLTGLLGWSFFQQTIITSMNKLVFGSSLLKHIYIPRGIFMYAVLGNGLVNLGFSLVPLVLIMLATRHPFHLALFFLPAAVLLLAMFTLGLSLILSTLAIYFTDVVEMFRVVLQAWFYATAVIYPPEIIPAKFQWVLAINPMYHMVRLFRNPIYNGVFPTTYEVMVAALSSIIILAVGWWLFTKKAEDFAYRI